MSNAEFHLETLLFYKGFKVKINSWNTKLRQNEMSFEKFWARFYVFSFDYVWR